MAPPPIELDQLLANSGWVRQLARRLVRDDDLADDITQDVWITALEHPPDKPQALQGWLAKVTRTRSYRENRTRARRTRRENIASEREAQRQAPTPTEMAERLEMHGILSEAVLSLAEPYRSSVYLRFYEDLSPQDIATRMETSASTVRTRISRGLKQLEEILDTRYTDSGYSWRALLIPIAYPHLAGLPSLTGTSSAAASSAGRVATSARMSTASWLTLTGVLVIASAVFWAVQSPQKGDPSRGETALQSAQGGPGIGAGQGIGGQGAAALLPGSGEDNATATGIVDEESDGEAAPAPETIQTETVQAQAFAAPESRWIRVLDADTQQPIVDAQVYLGRQAEGWADEIGVTDNQGRRECPQQLYDRAALLVLADQYVEYREPPRSRGVDDDHVVLLRRAFPTTIQVEDDRGLPVHDASITIQVPTQIPGAPAPQQLVTDATGQATFDYKYLDTQAVIRVPGSATVAGPVTTPQMTVALVPGKTREVLVVDADGQAVTHCAVRLTSQRMELPIFLQTDANGAVELEPLAAGDSATLRISPVDRPGIQVTQAMERPSPWRIELPAPRQVTGRLVDQDSQPISGAFVFVATLREPAAPQTDGAVSNLRRPAESQRNNRTDMRRSRYQLTPFARTRSDQNGDFEVGPRPDTDAAFLLVVSPHHVNHVALLDGDDLGTISMAAGRMVSGQVFSTTGEPVAGALLHLGELWSNDMESMLGRVRTNEQGHFTFRGVPTTTGPAGSRPNAPYRSHVFVTAFAPEEIVVMNDQLTADSPIVRSGIVADDVDELELTVGTPQESSVHFDLVDESDLPVRCATPVLSTAENNTGENNTVQRGLLGPSGRRVFAAENLELSESEQLLFLFPEHCWSQLNLAKLEAGDKSESSTSQTVVATTRGPAARLAYVGPTSPGAGAAELAVWVGFPFDSATPTHRVQLGALDKSARLVVDCLSPGSYRLFVAPAVSSGASGVVAPIANTTNLTDVGAVSIQPGLVTLTPQ